MGVPDIVATLLLKAALTPEGRLDALTLSVVVQMELTVYCIGVIAVVAVTVCVCEPLVSAIVNSLPHSGLLEVESAEFAEKPEGSVVRFETHHPVKS